jgi:hypothetical protein
MAMTTEHRQRTDMPLTERGGVHNHPCGAVPGGSV